MRIKTILLALVAGIGAVANSAQNVRPDTATLDNGTVRMEINLFGGALSSYTLEGSTLNPFSWRSSRNAGSAGFFLCFDRMGHSSKEEEAQGMPFHGEAHSVLWSVLEKKTAADGTLQLRMQCALPMAKMSVIREYYLFPQSSVCRVTDHFKNNNPFEKRYNILQHPSFAPPFLDKSVLIDCNASSGFVNSAKVEELPRAPIGWPDITHKSTAVNLSRMTNGPNMVVNYLCPPGDQHGWSCIANPAKGLLVGVLWDTSEYPWIRIWRQWQQENPTALGLEFGTSPLEMPFDKIEQVGDTMGHPMLHTLPPGGEVQKTFYLFMSKIPGNFAGVETVSQDSGRLTVVEKASGPNRSITLTCGAANPVIEETK